jgi:hypothetical protein
MRLPILFAFLIGLQLAAAETTNQQARLSGIVNLPGLKLAIIENSKDSSSPRSALWVEGQRDGDLGIQRILPESESVAGVFFKTNLVTFRFEQPPTQSLKPPTVRFDKVSLGALLVFYERLSERSLLQSPLLPRTTFSAQTDTTNRNEVLALLERQLEEQGISVVRDGEKFVAVLPKAEAARFKPNAPPLKAAGSPDSSDEIPPGSINLTAARLFHCLTIYAEFAGKDLDRSSLATLPDRWPIVFYNCNTLTKAECRYALETVLKLHGVELQPAPNGMIRAVSISEAKN